MTNGASIAGFERRLTANPSSPLFARLAAGLLAHGETGRAESLCHRGLGLYPNYTTGRLVLARCHAARGRYTDALRELHAVAGEYPGNILLADLADEWEARAAEGIAAPGDDGAEFIDLSAAASPAADDDPEVIEAVVVTGEETTTEPVVTGEDSTPEPIVTRVATVDPVAKRTEPDHTEVLRPEGVEPPIPVPSLHAPPVPILPPVPLPPVMGAVNAAPSMRPLETALPAPTPTEMTERTSFIEGDRIVSRTLAEIYASQGAIGEAVATYRLLVGRMPSERMAQRLRELEERLGEDVGPRPEPKE